MAEAKFIVMFVIMASLTITIFSTQVCGMFTTATDDLTNVVGYLYDMSTFQDSATSCQVGVENQINQTTPSMQNNFTNATSGLVTLSGGATGSFGVSSFIDVIKLIGGIVGFLLGLPLYTFLFVIGIPFIVALPLSIFLAVMYILGWVEFIRGGSL